MRGRKHKKKLAVKWLEDISRHRLVSAVGGSGVFPKLAVPVTLKVTQLDYDPSELLWTALPNERKPSVRDELLAKPGWRMVRLVGDWPICLKQAAKGPEDAVAAAIVKVWVGLCMLPINADGLPNEDELTRFTQGPLAFPETIVEETAQMEGNGAPWIWRRSWLLQNFVAGQDSGYTQYLGPTQVGAANAFTTSGSFRMAYASNVYYPSSLGHTFDIKSHVTVPQGHGLFWVLEACDTQGNASSWFELLFIPGQARMLIARPGRQSKRLAR